MVNAHLPVLPQHRQQEQRGDHAQPKHQVQQKGQPTAARAVPDGPHQVIERPQRPAQENPLAEHRRLAQHIHMHGQRSRREKNPPRLPASSS